MNQKMPKVVSREEWLRARKELLVKEKEWSRQRAAQTDERRKLPMVRIDGTNPNILALNNRQNSVDVIGVRMRYDHLA